MTKETFIKAWARELSVKEDDLYDFYNKVILFNNQLEPEGEITTATDQRPVIEQIVINVLNGMVGIGGIPGNKDFCDEFDMRLRAAMDVSQPPPQQPSDGEIDALVTKLRADKTLGINEDKKKIIKAAIKQLLNR